MTILAKRIPETRSTRSVEICVRLNGRNSTLFAGFGRARLPITGARTYALMLIAAPFWPGVTKRYFFLDDRAHEISSAEPVEVAPFVDQKAVA